MNAIGTETAFFVGARVAALERQGKKIIKFHIGQPDFHTPQNVKDAAKRAIDADFTGYTEAGGIYDLRKACADYAGKMRGLQFDPDEVVCTPGAKPIIFGAIFCLLEPGDQAIYPNPGFPIYESAIDAMGAQSIPLPLLEENGFNFDGEQFKEAVNKKTKMVIINSPQNPTGGVLADENLKLIRDLAVDDGFIVFSDEVYSRSVYDGQHKSVASLPLMKERTIVLDGHSKTYSMTGWRLGYGIMPKWLASALTTFAINVYSCPTSFVQKAGIEALTGPQDSVGKNLAQFRKRRDHIVKRLNEIEGVRCNLPKGAFYAFPNIKEICRRAGMKSSQVEAKLLENGVSVLSGSAFGRYGEGYLRMSYALDIPVMDEGLDIVKETLEGLGK
jgi:aspartate/methionine/tyrosine aminotransferase